MNLHAAEIGPRGLYEQLRRSRRSDAFLLKAARRVFLGSDVSLLFESRETLLHELHEIIRANNTWDARRIGEEIAEYQHLMPRSGTLTTTFMQHGGCPDKALMLCRRLAQRPEDTLHIEVGSRRVPARIISALGALECPVQYLRFEVGNDLSHQLLDSERSAALHVFDGAWQSFPLPRNLRTLLAAQLDEYGQAPLPSPPLLAYGQRCASAP